MDKHYQFLLVLVALMALIQLSTQYLYHSFYPYYFPDFGGYGFGYGFRAFNGRR
uniref:Uncharacterized protein n=1 Tax=Tetranychus urticae TaxID=32264 RepID=T1JV96_TETUR